MSEAPTTTMVAAAVVATTISDEEVADEDEYAEAAEEITMTIMILSKVSHVTTVKKRSLFLRLQGAQEKWK
jgi:hypothetical protein